MGNTSNNELKNDFNRLVDKFLLDAAEGDGKLFELAHELCAVLARITDFSADQEMQSGNDVVTDSGVAIMPVQAAKCLKEALRSHRFLTGIKQAIDDKLAEKTQIQLLYAGSGPWGSIVIPLLHFYKPEQIQITLLDIHQINLDCIAKLTKSLELTGYFKKIELADASKWQPDSADSEFDIIVSETMNNMLKREPQVAIFAHLQQFLCDDGCLIPEAVHIHAWARSAKRKANALKAILVKDLFTLNQGSAKDIRDKQLTKIEGQFTIPDEVQLPCHLEFATVIDVYKNIGLEKNQCSLNVSVNLNSLSPTPGEPIVYAYHINQSPDWQFDYQSETAVKPLVDAQVKNLDGLMHLRRFWDKYRRVGSNELQQSPPENEHQIDLLLMNTLEIPLHEGVSYVTSQLPDFDEFEAWVKTNKSAITEKQKEEFNHAVVSQICQ